MIVCFKSWEELLIYSDHSEIRHLYIKQQEKGSMLLVVMELASRWGRK